MFDLFKCLWLRVALLCLLGLCFAVWANNPTEERRCDNCENIIYDDKVEETLCRGNSINATIIPITENEKYEIHVTVPAVNAGFEIKGCICESSGKNVRTKHDHILLSVKIDENKIGEVKKNDDGTYTAKIDSYETECCDKNCKITIPVTITSDEDKKCPECENNVCTLSNSYWNFLSGRFEQNIPLQTNLTGLSISGLHLIKSNFFSQAKEYTYFADNWNLSIMEYLQFTDAKDEKLILLHQVDGKSIPLVKASENLYYSSPNRNYTLRRVDGKQIVSDRFGNRKIFGDFIAYSASKMRLARLEQIAERNRGEVTLKYNDKEQLVQICNRDNILYRLQYNQDNRVTAISGVDGELMASFIYSTTDRLAKIYLGDLFQQKLPAYTFKYDQSASVARLTASSRWKINV